MKTSILYGSLIALLGTSVYAAEPAATSQTTTTQSTTVTEQPAATSTTSTGNTTVTTPATTTTTTPVTTSTTPVTTTTSTPVTTSTTPITTSTTPVTTTTTPVTTSTTTTGTTTIDCTYRIPASTTNVDQNIVLQWAQNAIQQSFDLDHNTLETQLGNLKACFTDQGWQSFSDALNKSGNVDAIKSQGLLVSSIIDGQGTITVMRNNQWRATFPLQVVYQNDRQKMTQLLTVNLVIGRKANGDLGIMQIIATPRQAGMTTTTQPATTTVSQPVTTTTEPVTTTTTQPATTTTTQPAATTTTTVITH